MMYEKVLTEIRCVVGFEQKDLEILKEHKEWMTKMADVFVEEFYRVLPHCPTTSKLFQPWLEKNKRTKLKAFVLRWLSGEVSLEELVRIGFVHFQKGVKPVYVLAMISRLEQIFVQKWIEEYSTERELFNAFKRFLDVWGVFLVRAYYEALIIGLGKFLGISRDLIEKRVKPGADILEELAEG